MTATAVCGNDLGHVLTETVPATGAVTTEPGCETKGEKTFTSEAFESEVFSVQTAAEDIDPAGHDWGEPVWKWTGTKAATATFTCGTDESHSVTLDAEVAANDLTKLARYVSHIIDSLEE